MRTVARLLVVLLLSSLVARASPAPDPAEGTRGGKWDDVWPVFIEVHAGEHPGEYKVSYHWLEDLLDPDFSNQDHLGRRIGPYLRADFLIFKVAGNSGMLYGAFAEPRMANLVRIPPGAPDFLKIKLENYGWRPGAIPAEEALKAIKAGDSP